MTVPIDFDFFFEPKPPPTHLRHLLHHCQLPQSIELEVLDISSSYIRTKEYGILTCPRYVIGKTMDLLKKPGVLVYSRIMHPRGFPVYEVERKRT